MFRAVLDLFFPPRCPLCDEVIAPRERPLCRKCRTVDLPVVEDKRCKKCGRGKKQCACKLNTLLSDGIAAPFYYKDGVANAILRLKKVEDDDRYRYFLQELTAQAYLDYADIVIDAVTVVPMHSYDETKRGFNQVEPIAKGLAKALHVPYMPLLKKSIRTKSQKSLSGAARAANLLGVFDVLNQDNVRGKRILLVDDVVTTGATTNECAKMLKIYGAAAVYVLACAVSANEQNEENEIEQLMKQKRREKVNGG